MKALLQVSSVIDTITTWIGKVAYWLIPVMVLVGVWNVFGRFFGQAIEYNLTSNALIESQWYIFGITIFLGAPYALLHNEHVRVDVVYARLTDSRRAIVNIVGTVFFLFPFCILLIYFSWNFITTSWAGWEQSPDPSGLPRYPIKTMIWVGAALLMVQGVSELIKNIAFLTGDYLPPGHETAPPPPEESSAQVEETTPAQSVTEADSAVGSDAAADAGAGSEGQPDPARSDNPTTSQAPTMDVLEQEERQ